MAELPLVKLPSGDCHWTSPQVMVWCHKATSLPQVMVWCHKATSLPQVMVWCHQATSLPQVMVWCHQATSLPQVMVWCHQATSLPQVMVWCHQAFTWTIVDPYLCHNMALQGHNEFNHVTYRKKNIGKVRKYVRIQTYDRKTLWIALMCKLRGILSTFVNVNQSCYKRDAVYLLWREHHTVISAQSLVPVGVWSDQHPWNKIWGRFKKAYELVNLGIFKSSLLNKIHIFQCMGEIFCLQFQNVHLNLHTKYLNHTCNLHY